MRDLQLLQQVRQMMEFDVCNFDRAVVELNPSEIRLLHKMQSIDLSKLEKKQPVKEETAIAIKVEFDNTYKEVDALLQELDSSGKNEKTEERPQMASEGEEAPDDPLALQKADKHRHRHLFAKIFKPLTYEN